MSAIKSTAFMALSALVFATTPAISQSSSTGDIKNLGDWMDADKQTKMRFVSDVANVARKTNYHVIESQIYACLERVSFSWPRHVGIDIYAKDCSTDKLQY